MSRTLLLFKRIILGLAFGIVDLFSRSSKDTVLLSTHYSIFETDCQYLVEKLPETLEHRVVVSVRPNDSVDNEQLLHEAFGRDHVELVELNTLDFFRALLHSHTVILKGGSHLHSYRFFTRQSSREYILFNHGLITKAYDRTIDDRPATSVLARVRQWLRKTYKFSNVSVQSVSSEVERYFRASAEGRHPQQYREFGYPRYDRIRDLIESDATPRLLNESEIDLGTDAFNVLYAPTHKDGVYSTTICPFDDFDPDEFRSFLRENQIRLFLRMHPNEADHPQLDELIDEETILSAGQELSHSSIELLPYMDALVTDYSSIYMDYVPFDKPIVFVKDNHEVFKRIRGLAFDYDRYFPGEKVGTQDDFHKQLQTIKEQEDDGYAEERLFVRNVLLPEYESSCLDRLIDHIQSNQSAE